tara:strand:+ start:1047 stop:1277 length:231 start_codon:yes stop_codon:yes gene_type:complete
MPQPYETMNQIVRRMPTHLRLARQYSPFVEEEDSLAMGRVSKNSLSRRDSYAVELATKGITLVFLKGKVAKLVEIR